MTESRFDPEDEAFNDIERMSKVKQEIIRAAERHQKIEKDQMYITGWNAALDMAAYRLDLAATRVEEDPVSAFGADTLIGIAVHIRGLKK